MGVSALEGKILPRRTAAMHQTQKNIAANPKVLLTVGAREVAGKRGQPGASFLVTGATEFLLEGEDSDRVKAKLGWVRAALKITESATQTL